jgi:RNA polymerase sigma-70 factor (ECF subfamily)
MGTEQSAPPGQLEPRDEPEERAGSALERGDLGAVLDVLMDAYGEQIYRFCRRMMADEAAAEDVHQLTFVQAYQSLPAFARRSSFRTWLYGIARHRCLDTLKRRRRWRARFELVDDPPEVADPTADLHRDTETSGISSVLAACLERLAPRVRETVALRYQGGLSYAEIGEVLGERPPTLRVRVARAMPVLRRCVEEQGVAL